MNEGDWICSDPNCGNINFARRVSCYRCNKEKPEAFKKKLGTEIGKSAAEKSRGLFNADDWQCNKCANVNWARRQTCNVCNAPKFGEVEARTGYGGGYNERGNVEYRRREPSSDDEYDEFGRKKRKRKDEQDKVGITEGPVNKKLPPTMLQKDLKLDHVMPLPPSSMPQVAKKDCDKKMGSLSDGSVCDVPVMKMSFRKYPYQNRTNNNNQDHKLPYYKTNGHQSRKRFCSSGDKDHTGSSGYETGSKKPKYDINIPPAPAVKSYNNVIPPPVAKSYNNPVMENRVSSTNNDFLYKLSGQVPEEEFQVTYTIEEKVKAAALAIVYNNCKISSNKFRTMFDKLAPDYETIFSWRQRLLTTGCIVDSHIDAPKKDVTTPSVPCVPPVSVDTAKPKVQRVPNPDEIPIASDSECDYDRNSPTGNKSSHIARSLSADTLIVGMEGESKPGGGSLCATEDRESHSRSNSTSSNCRTRSSSRDSQDSNYPDSDCEVKSKLTKSKNAPVTKTITPKQSIHDSDSCSISYNSEDEDFLSRSFGSGKKVRRKVKRRPVPAKLNNYQSVDIPPFKGYNTLNSSAQSPLVTGNIYTSNLRNMAVKQRNRETNIVDTDGCSSEYVPTKLGATAKRNYQEFKNNVKRKGFWAKGNGASLIKPKPRPEVSNPALACMDNNIESYPTQNQGYMSAKQPAIQNRNEFIKNDLESLAPGKQYVSFEKPVQTNICAKTNNTSNYREKTGDTNIWAKSTILERPEQQQSLFTKTTEKSISTNVFGQSNHNDRYAKSAEQTNNIFDKPVENSLYAQSATKTSCVKDINKPIQNVMYTSTSGNSFQTTKSTPLTTNLINAQDSQTTFFDKPLQNVFTSTPELTCKLDKSLPSTHTSVLGNNPSNIFSNVVQTSLYGKAMEDSSSIFNMVQSSSGNKNRSITDIFDLQCQKSPEINNDLEKYDNVRKMYETEWDDDDDALYNTDRPKSPTSKQSVVSSNNVSSQAKPYTDYTNNTDSCKDTKSQFATISMNMDRCEKLLDLFDNAQRNKETQIKPNTQTSPNFATVDRNFKENMSQNLSHDFSTNTTNTIYDRPNPIPIELSNEIKSMSETDSPKKNISPSKRVQILESITILPKTSVNSSPHIQNGIEQESPSTSPSTNVYYNTHNSHFQHSELQQSANESQINNQYLNSLQDSSTSSVEVNKSSEVSQSTLDLSNLLAGINTNTLLLALQNLQQLKQNSASTENLQSNESTNNVNEENKQNVETINLTNDEDWEKESNREGSIERQLAKLDGNTGDTPFLSDMFDPGPVIIPPNVAKKLNLNICNPDENKNETQPPHLNENAPVIGNFKSFALPKPILLNRLKLSVKTPDRSYKKGEGKKNKHKKKGKGSTSQEGEEGGEDEEESGDEADLSKYDLWGSDGEQGNSSKHDTGDKCQEGNGSKEAGSESGDKNGQSPSRETKNSKRRSRSSSSSSSSSPSSSSSHSSDHAPKNKFDDFNLNSERESVHGSPKGRKTRSRSRSPRPRGANPPPPRRKSRDSRSAGETRSSRDKEKSRERERRDRSRGACDERKPRRYSRDSKPYSGRGRHR